MTPRIARNRSSRLVASAPWALCAAWGCTDGFSAQQELGQLGLSIVGGNPSDESQNAVVVVSRSSFLEFCTGVVVAPRVVLTARHCLLGPLVERGFYQECEEPALTLDGFVWDPEIVAIMVGRQKPLSIVTYGAEVHTPDELDLCLHDLALLELHEELPVAALPLRLDGPPVVGEAATLVGWGYTATDEPYLPDPRQQRDTRVEMLGAGNYERSAFFINSNSFVAGEAGCNGDEGAPLISAETGAVIGVQQAILSLDADMADARARSCLGGVTVLQRLDLQASWIRSTLRALGTAPWIEGKQPPAPLRSACADADECISGVCVSAGADRYCSVGCDDAACPEGMQCVGPDSGRVCAIDLAGSSEDAACSSGGRAPPGSFPAALGGLIGVAAARRARRPIAARRRA
jgi:hypothetical protein